MIKHSRIGRDTVFLTAVSASLQTLSLLVNVYLTKRLGAAPIGAMSLVLTFYGFACVIGSGNVFVCTSRLVSEEEGKTAGNPERVLRSALIFTMFTTALTMAAIFTFSTPILAKIGTSCPPRAIRLLACGLPLSGACAALKGYFHAKRRPAVPAASEAAEFLIKSAVLMFCVQFFVLTGKTDIYTSVALSIIIGESAALCILGAIRIFTIKAKKNPPSIRFASFIRLSVPIMLNSYVCAAMSSANDFLMPLTLRQSGGETAEALAKFGIFEAIVLPVLFFPSCVTCSLSLIMLPEISRARGAGDVSSTGLLARRAIESTLKYSILVSAFMLFKGNETAMLISGETLAGSALSVLAPVIPFIYLEIILEGIIKGLGMHGFSSLNYMCEYVIRISLLLICVPLLDFTGVIISYAVSNIFSNTVRLFTICKKTRTEFRFGRALLIPALSASVSVLLALASTNAVKGGISSPIAFAAVLCPCYLVANALFPAVINRKRGEKKQPTLA